MTNRILCKIIELWKIEDDIQTMSFSKFPYFMNEKVRKNFT